MNSILLGKNYWLQRGLAVLLVFTSLFSLFMSPAYAEVSSPAGNTIHGTVTTSGGGAALGAKVIAWQSGFPKVAVTVDPTTGAYSLSVGSGMWQINVLPPTASAITPDWVYTGGPQYAVFNGNPDPGGAQTLNFIADLATGIISGDIQDPSGSSDFVAPHRVWIRAETQEGQGNSILLDTNSTGNFSIKVLPNQNVFLRVTPEDPTWAPPQNLSGAEWFIPDLSTITIPSPIQLVSRDKTIEGIVRDDMNNPVSGIKVRAWRVDGSEIGLAVTDNNGIYNMPVVAGIWEVRAVPEPTSNYISPEDPVRVRILPSDSPKTVDLSVVVSDTSINGQIWLNSALLTGAKGRVFPVYQNSDGKWVQFSQGAVIINGTFTLKVSSKTSNLYELKTTFAAGSNYTQAGKVWLDLSLSPRPNACTATTNPCTIPVAANNSTISGSFNTQIGAAWTGHPGIVFGWSDSGALGKDKIDPNSGHYSINAAAVDTSGHGGTTWWLHAFVDPTTGYTVSAPRNQKVFLPYNGGAGANVTADFTVAKLDSLIKVNVLDEHNVALPGAHISIVEKLPPEGSAFHRWGLSNQNGVALIGVPTGLYEVRVEYLNKISPDAITIAAPKNSLVQVTMKFHPKNAVIQGVVTLNGISTTAFVRAYSDAGAQMFTTTNLDGTYSLPVFYPGVWHVQAVGEDSSSFYKSDRVRVIVNQPVMTGIDFALVQSETLPQAVAFTFDPTLDQTFTLENGAQIVIPAGAMATSGSVTLLARPLADLADSAGTQPVSFGYRLLALEENGSPISSFYSDISLKFPFTDAQLAALGVTPDQLIPSYWDASTSSWKPVDNYSVSHDSTSGTGMVNISVNHFTDYATLADIPQKLLFLPSLSR